MENIGLSTAPSGIGSGEAQIVKFDKTLAGLAANQKAEAKAKADADKELKNTLDKISIDGIHTKDNEAIAAAYENVLKTYGNLQSAKTREERIKAAEEHNRSKKQFELDINESKQRNKDLVAIGSSITATGNAGRFSTQQKMEYRKALDSPTSGYELYQTDFMPKPDPEDIVKTEKSITEAATADIPTTFVPAEIDKKDYLLTENGKYLSKNIFTQYTADAVGKSADYYDFMVTNYGGDWERVGKKISDADFLDYAIDKRFKDLQEVVNKTTKSASGSGNGFNFNFGGGSAAISDPGINQPVESYVTAKKYIKAASTKGEDTFLKMNIPVIKSTPINIKYETNAQDGFFKLGDGNAMIKSATPIKLTTTRIIAVPVIEGSGSYYLANTNSYRTDKKSAKIAGSEKTNNYTPKQIRYVNMLEANDEDGNVYLQPLGSLPQDRIAKADQPAILESQTWKFDNYLDPTTVVGNSVSGSTPRK
jgi:hypothetical protein